jgi:flagellar biosynthetic protein FlhB
MAEHSAQERTEAPTARKLRKAREDGQVARSTELPAAMIVIGTFLMILISGGWLVEQLGSVFAAGFVFDLRSLTRPLLLPSIFGAQLQQALILVLPLMLLTLILAIVATGLTGGFLFTLKPLAPQASKINPIEGFKRMFGLRAVVELSKALLKFVLVSTVLWWVIAADFGTLMRLGRMNLEPALASAAALMAKSALWVALSLALIAMIDVPWQKHQFVKRMRMTRQEIKDEFKEVEGRPEIKAQIQRRQREMAQRRMLTRVRDADVVITNPEHFAIALEYDPSSDRPPMVIAKGVDHMAQKIREQADHHGIERFEAPELARALYFTTDLDRPIPEDLYRAVAQVIAYVYSLQASGPAGARMRRPAPEVPPTLRFDRDGRPLTS